jgi:hypothetical protein
MYCPNALLYSSDLPLPYDAFPTISYFPFVPHLFYAVVPNSEFFPSACHPVYYPWQSLGTSALDCSKEDYHNGEEPTILLV